MLSFVDQDGRTVRIEVSRGKVRWAIDSGGYEIIPYYVPDLLDLSDKEEKTFIYYSRSGKIERIEINLEAQIGGINWQSETMIALRIIHSFSSPESKFKKNGMGTRSFRDNWCGSNKEIKLR